MFKLSSMNGSLRKDQLICPIPHRMMASSPCTERATHKSYANNHSYAVAGNEGEPSYEILEILLSKALRTRMIIMSNMSNRCHSLQHTWRREHPSNESQYGDQTNAKNSHPYFCGSPPTRSDNPLVRDAQFIRKGVPLPPVNLSQNTSCGASYGAKPLVRVEGFSSKNQESRRSLPAFA